MSDVLVAVSTHEGDKFHSITGDCGQLQPFQYTRRDTDGIHQRGTDVIRLTKQQAKSDGYTKCASCEWAVKQAYDVGCEP